MAQVHPQAGVTVGLGAASGGGVANGEVANPLPTTALYVGDLDLNVTDAQLFELFSQVGRVESVRVCRDMNTRISLGYAYVNFADQNDAARALEVLKYTPLHNKPIRIMYSNRDPSTRRSGSANIFIKNLDKSIDNRALNEIFSTFGSILSCKVETDASGQSRGFGFVQYEHEEEAQNAINKLNGMLLNDRPVYVGPFLRKQDRENSADKAKFNNVFVKNLSESTTKEDLQEIFGKFGAITSAIVMADEDGKSKCFGFVNFENPDDAARAVQELNGKKFEDKEWFVGKAQKKADREMELKAKFDQIVKESADKYHGKNLYLKNLDDSVGDSNLRDFFSSFGTITSCKVMRDHNGISKGSGFVAFSSSDEASRAMSEMNGKMVAGKPLYVALAQRKEERKARLQAQFSQIRPVSMPPAAVGPRASLYAPGGPGLGQQLFYGQGPPAMIPQGPFGFQQLIPGMRPPVGAVPNFIMPMVQPGQPDQRTGGGRRGPSGPVQQPQPPMSMMPPQMMPRGRMYRYPPMRNMPDVQMPGIPGGMHSPYDMGGLPIRDSPIPVGTLASALANASPDQQRTMLGENLYPLVEQLERDHAAKVTGMLLEMDQTEVLHLIESPDALKSKVAEAMEVLRSAAAQQQLSLPADQLSALSL